MNTTRHSQHLATGSGSAARRLDGRWIVTAMLLLALGLAIYAVSHFLSPAAAANRFLGS